MFVEDGCRLGVHIDTHTHIVRLSGSGSWSIAEPAEQTGSFIMIAAGISGHNYQRRLIHSLIASFNLLTFGGEQCQPACSRKQFAPRTCNAHDRKPPSPCVQVDGNM